ncbi:MAG: hypothetical protein IT372_15780 [Polyangiaceae bacterium]|nr:hypothetical protein [Polyangiaceae bacterium]
MTRHVGSELTISMWSPEWLDGRGVARVAAWYLEQPAGWRAVQIHDANEDAVTADFDMIRTSGAIHPRSAPLDRPSDALPVIYEMSRLRQERGKRRHTGPLEERIVEYAVSVVPCSLGFHAVDVRRPVPQDVWEEKRRSHAEAMAREVLGELRSIYASMPLAWAVCSTFGRGPSMAELYRKGESTMMIGAVYVSKIVPAAEIAESFRPARIADVGSGYEVPLVTLFGGEEETVLTSTYDGIWRVLRKAALTGLPWDVLSRLGRTPPSRPQRS